MSQSQSPSFFGKLKSFVVEEVPETQRSSSVKDFGPPPTRANPAPAAIATVRPNSSDVDPEVLKILEKDIEEAAHPAYSQFSALAESMAGVIPDETTRYRAALAALAPKGIELRGILIDVDECLQALDTKQSEAQKAAQQALTSRVGSKEKELDSLDKSLIQLDRQRQEIAEKMKNLSSVIESEAADIRATEARFLATVSVYRQELLDRKRRISNLSTGV